MTPLHRAADALLAAQGYDGVREFVESHRAQGKSWRQIVRDLEAVTDGVIVVTEVTLRSWMDTIAKEAA